MFLAGLGPVGPTELILILVIVVLLFGAGKLTTLGRDLGQGIREFKKATNDPEEEARKKREEDRAKAQEAGRYVATNGVGEYRPTDTVTAPPVPPTAPARPPDFTGR